MAVTVNLTAVVANVTVAAVPYVGITWRTVTVPVAGVTVDAVPYTSITFSAPIISFEPATVFVRTLAPLGITLGPPAPVIDVLPAQVNVAAAEIDPIVGAFIPGDRVESAIHIRESGSMTIDMSDYDGVLAPGVQYVFFAYEADAPMELTLAATSLDPLTMGVYEGGPTISDMTNIANGSDITVDINSGITYIIINTTDNGTVDLVWSYDPVANDLMMDILSPLLDRTPNNLNASIIGGDPGESIRFTWSPPVSTLIPAGTRPITLGTITSDFEGNINTATLQLPAAPPGSYILEARGVTSGKFANGTFRILNAPLEADSGGTPAVPVESESIKWLWDDGVVDPWIMTNNPDRMTSPIKLKILSPERTTSGQGQHVIWQGATPAVDWSFNGTILTQAEREQFEYFYELNRKFYITTHRNVRYTVSFKSLEMIPRRNGSNFETWDYTANMFIYTETPVYKKALTTWNVGHL